MKNLRNLFMIAAVGGMMFACNSDVLSPEGQIGGGAKPVIPPGAKMTQVSASVSTNPVPFGGTTTISAQALNIEAGTDPKCGTLTLSIQAPGEMGYTVVATKDVANLSQILSFTTESLTVAGTYNYRVAYTRDVIGCNFLDSSINGTFSVMEEGVEPPACTASLTPVDMSAISDGSIVTFSITYRLALCDGATGKLQGGLSNYSTLVSYSAGGTDKTPGGKNTNKVITWNNAGSGDYTIVFTKPVKYANGPVTGQWTIKDAAGNELATAVAPQTFTIQQP